ncbi:hypothetical protein GWI33_018201 [Rhynchophorus ferrugineus]|uniref:Uncharacterized protein n=1 Tax=Rhynchophorus ferrugineus TaxID=354439 RepID=A0A834HTV8_RHYFE|nr:hypothetical protein GWI33_018201 [Rhynchophorus ferrugineus]
MSELLFSFQRRKGPLHLTTSQTKTKKQKAKLSTFAPPRAKSASTTSSTFRVNQIVNRRIRKVIIVRNKSSLKLSVVRSPRPAKEAQEKNPIEGKVGTLS